MIGLLKGTISQKEGNGRLLVELSGIGFSVFVPEHTQENATIGEGITLYTHLVVREDRLDLYGFTREVERTFFLQLVTVRDVGPKSALAILSLGNIAEVQQAIVAEDVDALVRVPGIGKKTAERIILELKEKIFPDDTRGPKTSREGTEAITAALVHLGYSSKEAKEATRSMPKDLPTDDERLRWVLRNMGH